LGNSNLDRIYTASGDAAMREAYDEWATEYDKDVESSGYLTPSRVAKALVDHIDDKNAPVMDYGCGTGLSGIALKQEGFGCIDGADLSQKMLDIAKDRDVYRDLHLVEPGQPLSESHLHYSNIVATGVISRGAAPPSMYGDMLDLMKPGSKLAFSMNDLSLEDPEYAELVDKSVEAGKVKRLFEEYGPHLTKYGKNSQSKVYVVERVA